MILVTRIGIGTWDIDADLILIDEATNTYYRANIAQITSDDAKVNGWYSPANNLVKINPIKFKKISGVFLEVEYSKKRINNNFEPYSSIALIVNESKNNTEILLSDYLALKLKIGRLEVKAPFYDYINTIVEARKDCRNKIDHRK